MAPIRKKKRVKTAPVNKIDEGASIAPRTPDLKLTGEPFPAGAEVEVSSDDSWCEAVVQRHYKIIKHFKYQVQLLKFSGEKLVEDVHVLAKNVRPRAPRRFSSHGPSFALPNNEDEDSEFNMHDLVEASQDDRWWHGVISGLRSPDSGLYTVSFPISREVFQFKPADIRPQLTFANGLWSPVQRIPQKTDAYKEGDAVDVRRVRDDYGESWFCAQVKKVIHHSYYLVEYESLKAHPNGDLTEILDPQHLRPAVDCMPGTDLYYLGDRVEVLRGGGWSRGVVLSGPSGSNYGVNVEYKGEQMTVQFHISNMRLRPSKGKKRKSVNPNKIFASDVSSVDQGVPLPLSKNLVSTNSNSNSEFNKHTLVGHTLVKPVTREIVVPFEMASPFWKSLETSAVFARIPQRPHFKMLESECEEEREGKAIGMMVTYTNLVDSIPRLKIHTELKAIENKIACLDSLEKNGFIVDPMRSCLHRLLQIKTNFSKCALRRVELETKLAKDKDSLASANVFEDKLADINKSIAKLKEQLSIMEMQKKSVMEERAGISGLVAELGDSISRIEDEIFSINRSSELASEEFGRVISRFSANTKLRVF